VWHSQLESQQFGFELEASRHSCSMSMSDPGTGMVRYPLDSECSALPPEGLGARHEKRPVQRSLLGVLA
jgi:hypothetical protein